jgi:hypothetical protein
MLSGFRGVFIFPLLGKAGARLFTRFLEKSHGCRGTTSLLRVLMTFRWLRGTDEAGLDFIVIQSGLLG